jgi:hypothetical protein
MQGPIAVENLRTPPTSHEYVTRRGKRVLVAVMPLPQWDGTEPCVGDDIYTNERKDQRPSSSELEEMGRRCGTCPRFDACFEWAIAHEASYFWAGTTAQQRKAIRQHRKQSLVDPTYLFSLLEFTPRGDHEPS